MDSSATHPQHQLSVDVALVPSFLPRDAAGRAGTVYIVVDVIRATTTLSVLFERGIRRVLVAPGIEAARQARQDAAPGAFLAGEAGGLAPAGFDFGNSPRELAEAPVAGRDLIFATTNGTRALRACLGGRAIFAGAFRNADSVAALAVATALADGAEVPHAAEVPYRPESAHATGEAGASEADLGERCPDIVVVCSGRGDLPAYDDTLCAGYLVQRLIAHAEDIGEGVLLREGARIARACAQTALASGALRDALSVADAARATARVGLADDLLWCADLNVTSIVPAISGIEQSGDLIVVTADKRAGER